MDHQRAPILEAIQSYHRDDIAPFTTPGHKRGHGVAAETAAALGRETFLNDIPPTGGVDDRRMSKDVQGQAEELAADAYGAETSLFVVGGSTLSVQVVTLALADDGDEVLVARNVHKSVLAALIISGARPRYVYPAIDKQLEMAHGVTPEDLAAGFDAYPNVKGAIVVSPTYYGVAADVRTLAEICHQRGKPLVTDAAWAPHFRFHPDLPPSAIDSGADIEVASVHKVLTGLGQASIINVQGSLVDKERISMWLETLQTTSASSLIMGSIDGARRQMALHGEELWGRALALSDHARAVIATIPGLCAMGTEVVGRPGAAALDRTKLVVEVAGLGITGYEAADWLLEHRQVAVELGDQRRIMALITAGDDEASVGRLLDGLRALAERGPHAPPAAAKQIPDPADVATEPVLTPREAFFLPAEHVPIEKAAGRVIAEMLSPYPPGIPILVPGERVTQQIVDAVQQGLAAGMYIPDATDPSLKTLRVVR